MKLTKNVDVVVRFKSVKSRNWKLLLRFKFLACYVWRINSNILWAENSRGFWKVLYIGILKESSQAIRDWKLNLVIEEKLDFLIKERLDNFKKKEKLVFVDVAESLS